MQTEKFQPKSKWIMPETDRPRFRHYPFTPGLGFFGLQRNGRFFLSLNRNVVRDSVASFFIETNREEILLKFHSDSPRKAKSHIFY